MKKLITLVLMVFMMVPIITLAEPGRCRGGAHAGEECDTNDIIDHCNILGLCEGTRVICYSGSKDSEHPGDSCEDKRENGVKVCVGGPKNGKRCKGFVYADCADSLGNYGICDGGEKNGKPCGSYLDPRPDGPFGCPNGKCNLATCELINTTRCVREGVCDPANLVGLSDFNLDGDGQITWITNVEKYNAGFRIWRAVEDSSSQYTNISVLEEFGHTEVFDTILNNKCSIEVNGQLRVHSPGKPSKLINSRGDLIKGVCYSFTDTSISESGIYYYLLEDINLEGKRTFHCSQISAIATGKNLTIDLKTAKKFCEDLCVGNEISCE